MNFYEKEIKEIDKKIEKKFSKKPLEKMNQEETYDRAFAKGERNALIKCKLKHDEFIRENKNICNLHIRLCRSTKGKNSIRRILEEFNKLSGDLE